jgi:hypothetical protein
MLPGEIAPFADHHINELEAVLQILMQARTTGVPMPDITLNAAMDQVRSAQSGFVRFKVCMADEVKQKKRYEEYAKKHGYKYS